MKKALMIKELENALDSWERCSPDVKEKARLWFETWIKPNIEVCLEELKK